MGQIQEQMENILRLRISRERFEAHVSDLKDDISGT